MHIASTHDDYNDDGNDFTLKSTEIKEHAVGIEKFYVSQHDDVHLELCHMIFATLKLCAKYTYLKM